ncbi:GON-4-like protein [Osmerus mordax]|uniref:GON-4-like protein n=1 Tax=Osmerus mordax TaxID=8014 RepID=UPI00351011AE
MSLVRKRKCISVKAGGASKVARPEKPPAPEPPSSHNASPPTVEDCQEDGSPEEGQSTLPCRLGAKVRGQGQGPLQESDARGQGSREGGSRLCSNPSWPCPSTEEEMTDTDLLVIVTEEQCRTRQGVRKKGGGAKRKRRPAEDQSEESQSEEPGSEVEIDRQLDQQLENKSKQHNLTTTNVRNIIHEVITNEHVVAMMKAAINETEAVPVFEPKMTRSKLKEVVEKGVVIPAWNISPIKKASEVKAPQFVDIPLEDEDSSDEEYRPDEEEEDETCEDTFQESDMESTASSPRGVRAGILRAASQEEEHSSLQVYNHKARRRMGPPLPPPGPPIKPPPDSSFLEKLHAVEEELAIGPVPACMEPFQPLAPAEDSVMAWRTRSKRPLRDIPLGRLEAELRAPDTTPDMYECGSAKEDREWTHWLRGLMCSDAENDEEADDDDDPEYNFLADTDEPDVEDYRNDRAVRITKKEVNQLMEELFETFQEDLCSQEQDEEGHEEEEESQEESRDTHTFTTPAPPCPRWQEPVYQEEEDDGGFQTVREQLAAMRKKRLQTPQPPALTPALTPTVNATQKLQLQQQIQQHVQLLTQVYMLASPVAALHSEAHTTLQFLTELQVFAQQRELSQGPGSLFRASNLQGALSLLEELRLRPIPYSPNITQPTSQGRIRRYPLMPAQLAWLFATRPVFLYPELLPLVSLDPALLAPRTFNSFIPAEDCLLVLGMRNMQGTLKPMENLCQYLLRAKAPAQTRGHLLKQSTPRRPDSILKVYYRQRVVLPMPLACRGVEPGDQRPPVERDEDIMPAWLRRSLPVIYPAVRQCNMAGDPKCSKNKRYYSYPPGTLYPPHLPDGLILKPSGFKNMLVSDGAPSRTGGGTAPQGEHANNGRKQRPVQGASKPKSKTTRGKSRSKTSQNAMQVILNRPASGASSLDAQWSESALSAKELVTQRVSTFAGLHRLPRFLPPACPSHPHATGSLEAASRGTTAPDRPPATTQAPSLPPPFIQIQTSALHPSLLETLMDGECVTVVMVRREEEVGGDEEVEKGEEEEEEEDCYDDMPLLALSESSASPAGSIDPGDLTEAEPEKGQEVTLVPSPGQSDVGGGIREGEKEVQEEAGHHGGIVEGERQGQQEQEVMSPFSDESTLSVPELQETMEKLSWLASEGRLEVIESSFSNPDPVAPPPPPPPPVTPLPHDDTELQGCDPHREKEELAYAQDYLNRVCESLQKVPGRLGDFLAALCEFERGGGRTPVELFSLIRPVLQDWPDLLRDFAAFLHPDQAQHCGLLAEQQAFERSRRFLRQLELSFGEDSSHYRQIVSILQGGHAHSPLGIKKMKAQITGLLKGHSHLQEEFWVFFDMLYSLSSEAERQDTSNYTSHNAPQIGRRRQASNPRRTKRREQEEGEDGGDMDEQACISDNPVCAKNISLTPTGEKIILWTREADRTILTTCQLRGANQRTFQTISAELGNKTPNEVSARFKDLMRLFRSANQRPRSDQEEEVSATEQEINSTEPAPD